MKIFKKKVNNLRYNKNEFFALGFLMKLLIKSKAFLERKTFFTQNNRKVAKKKNYLKIIAALN